MPILETIEVQLMFVAWSASSEQLGKDRVNLLLSACCRRFTMFTICNANVL